MNRLQKGVVALFGFGLLTNLYAVQFEIMPTVGKKIRNKDTTLDDSKVLMGVRGTAYVTPNTGIQAIVESSLNNPTLDGGDTDIERAGLNAVYESTSGRIRPYVLAGVGYEWTHGESVKRTDDDSQPFASAGVGLKFALKDNLSLVTELKGIHKFENADDDIIGTVGLGMKIGAPKQKQNACSTAQQKVLSLDEFAKMCKTKPTNATSIVADKPMQVATMQHQPDANQAPQDTAEEIMQESYITESESVETVETPNEEVTIAEGYYVQMAALFKSNGSILTSKLERKNYPYVLYNTTRRGKDVTLVLVGPYQSKKEAIIARRYLKRLARGAFVKQFP